MSEDRIDVTDSIEDIIGLARARLQQESGSIQKLGRALTDEEKRRVDALNRASELIEKSLAALVSTNSDSMLLEFDLEPKDVRESLSVAVVMGDFLWVASDETTSIERLSLKDGTTFRQHKSFPLAGLINLPALETDFDQEIDIEGMAYQSDYLWIIGSHSIKRKKVKEDDTPAKGIKKIGTKEQAGNRYIFARIPVVKNAETGEPELRKTGDNPLDPARPLTAAQLTGGVESNTLVDAIKAEDENSEGKKIPGDVHLGDFLLIPGKDNGFDIEGLAVAGEKFFIGLRGPVLRGWAVILEVAVDVTDPSALRLKEIGPKGRLYKKHFLQLGGLGIRELCVDGSDLLILAGPTMELDGPVYVFRWKDGVNSSEQSLVRNETLERFVAIPFGKEIDHAEGMALIERPGKSPSLLIVYDSPGDERRVGSTGVKADIIAAP